MRELSFENLQHAQHGRLLRVAHVISRFLVARTECELERIQRFDEFLRVFEELLPGSHLILHFMVNFLEVEVDALDDLDFNQFLVLPLGPDGQHHFDVSLVFGVECHPLLGPEPVLDFEHSGVLHGGQGREDCFGVLWRVGDDGAAQQVFQLVGRRLDVVRVFLPEFQDVLLQFGTAAFELLGRREQQVFLLHLAGEDQFGHQHLLSCRPH